MQTYQDTSRLSSSDSGSKCKGNFKGEMRHAILCAGGKSTSIDGSQDSSVHPSLKVTVKAEMLQCLEVMASDGGRRI
jgi:hypothetical protein